MNRTKFVEDTVNMLAEQGSYAMAHSTGACMYKTPEGKKCAIGLHIPDDLYDPSMENQVVEKLLFNFPSLSVYLSSKYGEIQISDISFIGQVQVTIHDSRSRLYMPLLTLEEAKKMLSYFMEAGV